MDQTMKVLCIDDEPIILQQITQICRESECFASVNGCLKAEEALTYLEANPVDVVFLDINMPGMNGLSLAEKIKELYPETVLVFVTSYLEYAIDAFQLHADGYLTKPISVEDIQKEAAHINQLKQRFQPKTDVFIQTFGNFEVYVKGTPVRFERRKSKEILAYLVDKRGTGVSRAELASIIWEDELYDHSKQKQLDVFIQSLKKTLAAYDIQFIFDLQKRELRVDPSSFQCDFYDFLDGKANAKMSYCGSYLDAYSWAEYTKAYLSHKGLNLKA
ncbi:MAG: response regulator [Clostridiales bacterium]|nr:response regulator [Candidatus Blautia equi]